MADLFRSLYGFMLGVRFISAFVHHNGLKNLQIGRNGLIPLSVTGHIVNFCS